MNRKQQLTESDRSTSEAADKKYRGIRRKIKALAEKVCAIMALLKQKCCRSMQAKEPSQEEIFVQQWEAVLQEKAEIYCGLFTSMQRICDGKTKKPEKVLREWYQRTHYNFEGQPVDSLCKELFLPLIETPHPENSSVWAQRLLQAAAQVGIAKDESGMVVLKEGQAEAYMEEDGQDLYPEDPVEITVPAWYQNGKLLEQGQCRKQGEE